MVERSKSSDSNAAAGVSRRSAIVSAMAATGAIAIGQGRCAESCAATQGHDDLDFGYCLNTSTIRGQELGIVEEVRIAGEVGYDGIEPWIRELDSYVEAGGSLSELKSRIDDAGLSVASAIGFASWIVNDDTKRRAGLEQARRDMEKVRSIGGTRIAAPPAGVGRDESIDLLAAADRYAELLEVGREMGVMPQLEVWGFSPALGRLGQAVMVAMESGDADARLLLDVYHVFKGGSDLGGIRWLRGESMEVFHVNDYPGSPPREAMDDSHRVYPGDGVAPLDDLAHNLRTIGFRGMLSIELFNRDYWRQDATEVAAIALRKTKDVFSDAIS